MFVDKNLILKIDETKQEKGCLYLGNISGAQSVNKDNKENIKAVLTVASNTSLNYNTEEITQKIIEAYDVPNFNLGPSFEDGAQFINEQLQKTNVLVHCFAGVSRSTSLVLAYLMKFHNYSLDEGLKFIRTKRPLVQPNLGFMSQLQKYELELKNK